MRTLYTMTGREMGLAIDHPAQRRLLPVLAELITDLRACRDDADYFALQMKLLSHRQQHEGWRAESARSAKRVRQKKLPTAAAPPLEVAGGNPTDSASWQFQATVYTRLTHQLRSIGDALAWRVLDYRRDLLVALARHLPPGPMDPTKTGTDGEIHFVTRQWEDHQRLGLLHDLTNCLRIADVTVLDPEQQMLELYELKTNPDRKDPAQVARIRMAANAVTRGTALPGDDPHQRLLAVPIPYATHLDKLRIGAELARNRGAQTIAVPGGRAVEVYNLPAISRHWDEETFASVTNNRKREAARRAQVRGDAFIRKSSADIAGHDPFIPPWAIFPLPASDCALLIANYTVFNTTLSLPIVQDALRDAGVWSELAVGELKNNGGTVLRVARGNRLAGMGIMNFHPLLIELTNLDIWAKGVAHVLDAGPDGTRPWPFFQPEAQCWM
ncbi:hypothetical protein GCM10010430_34920 [Kitasatospora cystarginea]|uniref:Uncharacterized protein n=1 Tax=Kitasatospora cystarginea TaxID=58350 RepID=A0ABN3E6D4_9ACTN